MIVQHNYILLIIRKVNYSDDNFFNCYIFLFIVKIVHTCMFSGLIKDPSQSSYISHSVPNSDGVYFIPAFSGLQVKYYIQCNYYITYFWLPLNLLSVHQNPRKLIFSGVLYFQAPVNDSQAATGFLGIKPTTKSEHLVRAVLESIAFRVAQLYLVLKEESNFKSLRLRWED